MNIWLIIWLFIASTLLYFSVWTVVILYRQKKTWKAYAEKMGLRYTPGKLQDSPEISGNYKGYTVSLFTGEHSSADIRGVRKLSAIEVQISSKIPFEAGVASRGMVPFVKQLGFNEEINPKHEKWKKDYIAASSTPYALEVYLTKKRLEALLSLIRIKNAWVILVFRGDTALLRLDTPDPLDTEKKISAITDRMIDVAKILELESGESSLLKQEMHRTSPREASIHLKDKDISLDTSELHLEETEDIKTPGTTQPKKNTVPKDKNGNE